MRKFTDVIQDRYGNALQGASLKVTVANASPGTGANAAIYSDDGVTSIGTSTVTTDVNGRYSFYAADGRYDLAVSGVGITALVVSDVGEGGEVVSVKVLNGICFADQFAGSDIGAQVNTAITYLGAQGGTVIVPSGNYSFSTTITKPRNVVLKGSGAQSTILNYIGSTVAMAVGNTEASAPTGFTSSEYGVENISFKGPSSVGSTIGVFLGGDPSAVITPTNYFANGQGFYHFQIEGFGVGIKWGNNAYKNHFLACTIKGNGVNIYLPSGTTNSGENITFFDGLVSNSISYAVQQDMSASDIRAFGTSFDYNNDTLGPDFTGTSLYTELYGCHLEKTSSSFVDQTNGTFKMQGGIAELTSGSGTDTFMFHMAGTGAVLLLDGIDATSSHTVTQLVKWDATTSNPIVRILNPQIGSNISAVINSGFTVNVGTMVDDTLTPKRILGMPITFGPLPATVGQIRLSNAETIFARDAGNTTDRGVIGFDAGNLVQIDLAGGGANFGGPVTAVTSFSAPRVISTVATGTAPLTVTSTTPVANLACGPTAYNAAGTQQTATKVVTGTSVLSSGTPSTVTVTLSGSAIFTSSSSYKVICANETTAANGIKVTYTSGSQFTLTGPNTVTDSISWHAIGN